MSEQHRDPAYDATSERRQLDTAFTRILDAEDARLARGQWHEPLDPDRCEVCRWPLSKDPAGCHPRDCSYRERDGSDEHRRLRERREVLNARINEPLLEHVVLGAVPRPDLVSKKVVSHEEARAIAARYHVSHWYPRGTRAPHHGGQPLERARYSIPANHERDDDLRLSAYIARAEQLEAELLALREKLARLAARYVIPEAGR